MIKQIKNNQQQGMALIAVLIIVIVVTLLGVTAMRMSMTSLALATNSQASNLLFQAADLGLRSLPTNITNISEDVTNRIEKIQEIHDEEMKKVLDANRQERIEHENNIKKLQKLNCKNLISKSNFYNFEIKIQFL